MQRAAHTSASRLLVLVRAGLGLVAALAIASTQQSVAGAAPLAARGVHTEVGTPTVPSAPIGLAVASFTGTTVTLTWSAPASDGGDPVTQYLVQYRATTVDAWSDSDTVGPATPLPTTATVTGLTQGTKYEFRVGAANSVGTAWTPGGHGLAVVAYDMTGNANASEPTRTDDGLTTCLSATVPNLDYSWGEGNVAIAGSDSTCGANYVMMHVTGEIAWPGTYDGTNTSTVNLYGSHDDGVYLTINGTTVLDSWRIQGADTYNSENSLTLLAGGMYTFDLWFYEYRGGAVLQLLWDASGAPAVIPVSAFSATSQIPSVVPGITGIPTATPAYPSSLIVSWAAPSDSGGQPVTGYQVQYAVEGTDTWLPATPVAVTTTSARLSGLTANTTYKVRVAAVNPVGPGAPTASDPVLLVTPPGPPTGVTVTHFAATSATVAWQPPADNGGSTVTGYTLQYREAGSTSWASVPEDGETTSATVYSLTQGTTYAFRVRTTTALGDSTYSAPIADKLAASSSMSCAIVANGSVRCWGSNGDGQLGDGSTTDRLTPVQVAGVTSAVAVGTGDRHACAVIADGTVQCWGSNGDGQLGDGTTNAPTGPVTVDGISTAVDVAAGDNYTCAVLANGTVQCWGANGDAQLGDGTWDDHHFPAPVDDITTAVAVTASSNHACALLADGSVKCWGSNSGGRLGDGTGDDHPSPVAVTGVSTAVAISANSGHTCAALIDGTAWCWGTNGEGQLGDGSTSNQFTPVQVVGVSGAAGVTTGDDHSCALLTEGTMKCWGANWDGQLGDGTSDSRTTTAPVSNLTSAVVAASGNHHTCAILSDDTVTCWGSGGSGQLGNAATDNQWNPVAVTGLVAPAYVTAIPSVVPDAPGAVTATPAYPASLAVSWSAPDSDGGQPVSGYLVQYFDGAGSSWLPATPTLVTGTTTRLSGLTSGSTYTVRVRAVNGVGTGSGTVSSAVELLTPPGPPTALAVDSFTGSTVRLSWVAPADNGGLPLSGYTVQYRAMSSGTWVDVPVVGAGSTSTELTGLTKGTLYAMRVSATNANGDSTYSALPLGRVSAASDTTCVVPADGTVQCWGRNSYGQLGDGTTSESASPVQVAGVTSAVAVAVGDRHACALLAGGAVTCWGSNGNGRLGNGTTGGVSAPVMATGVSTAVAIAAGDNYTCAALSDGAMKCWGYNGYGQLGDDTRTQRTSPTDVYGISNAIAVTASGYHACALLADGTAACWGYNGEGELGDGTTTDSNRPVPVSDLTGALTISANGDHTCASLADGTVKCWGYNGWGKVGDGTDTDKHAPVAVPGITTAVGVTTGDDHSCAVLADGTMSCWGRNYGYELGDGTRTSRFAAAPVSSLAGAVAASSGGHHTCAILGDATVSCWGTNSWGQLGDGTWTSHGAATAADIEAVPGETFAIPSVAPDAAGTPVLAPAYPSTMSVSWAAPSDTGGQAVLYYALDYSVDGGVSWSPATPLRVAGTSTALPGLTGGASYRVRVTPVTPVGSGPTSTSGDVDLLTRPGAPAYVHATAYTGRSVTLAWTAPSDTGGSALTGNEVQYRVAGTEAWTTASTEDGAATTATVSHLSPTTTYEFRVGAVNAQATAWSPSTTGLDLDIYPVTGDTPNRTTTGRAPCLSTRSANVDLNWSSAPSIGGSSGTCPADYYLVHMTGQITWPGTYDGVTLMTLTLKARHDDGFSMSLGGVSRMDRWWSQSAYNFNQSTTLTLLAGQTYPFDAWFYDATEGAELRLVWSNGPSGSLVTIPTSAFTIAHATTGEGSAIEPGAPTGVSAEPGNGSADVSWTAPTDDGGSAITGYTVTASPGGATCSPADPATGVSCTVDGLTNGTAYTFTVTATNAIGTSVASSASSEVTPATSPDAPTGATAVAGAASAEVSWTAPIDDGGSDITGYTVTSSPGGKTCTSASSPCTVGELTNGTAYTFTVTATNAMGTSAASDASNEVTPATVPDAPTGASAVAAPGSATVSWFAPTFDGGSAITGYTVTASPGGATCAVTTLPADLTCQINGLTNGTAYTFTVTATNAVGDSAASTPSSPVTPVTVPDAPRTLVVSHPSTTSVGLTWQAPASNGGAAVTDYIVQYRLSGAGTWDTFTDGVSATRSATVTGLTTGSTSEFRVAAVNSAGTSLWSALVSTVAATTPGAVTALGATPATSTTLSVSWSAPGSTGGTDITDYAIAYSTNKGGSWTAVADGVSTSPSATISGLSAGTSYLVRVAAINAVGQGAWVEAAPVTITVALTPQLGAVASNAGGFTVAVTNYSGSYTWTVDIVAGSGSARIDTSGLVSVTKVTAGPTTISVTATLSGSSARSATAVGSATSAVTSLAPTSGAPGSAVTVTGTNLWGATAVSVGGVNVGTFTVLSGTSIVFGIPVGAATGRVSVTMPSGTVTSPGNLTVSAGSTPPKLASPATKALSATSGAPGTAVLIAGTNLGAATSVSLNGTPATFNVVSDSAVVASVPVGARTGAWTLTTAGGSVASATFTVATGTAAPTVTTRATSVKAGTFAALAGAHIGGLSGVTVNGSPAAYAVTATGALTVYIPADTAKGAASIRVTTPGGSVTTTAITVT